MKAIPSAGRWALVASLGLWPGLVAAVATAFVVGPTVRAWSAERPYGTLHGRDVEVPPAHVVAPLSGTRLRAFRQLAQDADVTSNRAHRTAKRVVGDYPARGVQFLGELHYFATRCRDLRSRTDASGVDPQQIGPIVDRLLEQARETDRLMRDASVFRSVLGDSGRTITILAQMASLVRS